jgi:O-antigen ligase
MSNVHPALSRKAFATAAFFALLPGVAVGGAIGLPLLLAVATLISLDRTSLSVVPAKNATFLILASAFLLWAALSSLWSPWAGDTQIKICVIFVVCLLFARLARAESALFLAGAVAALAVLIVLSSIEALGDSVLNRMADPEAGDFAWRQNPARGAVVMLALLWPAFAWVLTFPPPWKWPTAIALLAGAGFVAFQFDQQANALGLCVGLLFFLFGLAGPRLAILAAAWSLALWVAIAPFATLAVLGFYQVPEWLPHSWDVRAGVWEYTSERILERPWFGHGLDAGRATTEMTTYDGELMRVIPVHPHNAALQIWYETGVVGAALAVALLVSLGVLLTRTYTKARPQAGAAAAVVAMFGAMASIGWSLWQEWWLVTIMLSGALLIALGRSVRP